MLEQRIIAPFDQSGYSSTHHFYLQEAGEQNANDHLLMVKKWISSGPHPKGKLSCCDYRDEGACHAGTKQKVCFTPESRRSLGDRLTG